MVVFSPLVRVRASISAAFQVLILLEGIFMGKLGKKHGNVTTGGTVLRDGMRLWIDARRMRNLTLRTGDTCKC